MVGKMCNFLICGPKAAQHIKSLYDSDSDVTWFDIWALGFITACSQLVVQSASAYKNWGLEYAQMLITPARITDVSAKWLNVISLVEDQDNSLISASTCSASTDLNPQCAKLWTGNVYSTMLHLFFRLFAFICKGCCYNNEDRLVCSIYNGFICLPSVVLRLLPFALPCLQGILSVICFVSQTQSSMAVYVISKWLYEYLKRLRRSVSFLLFV